MVHSPFRHQHHNRARRYPDRALVGELGESLHIHAILIFQESIDTDLPLQSSRKLRQLHGEHLPVCVHSIEYYIIRRILLISARIHHADQPAVVVCPCIPRITVVNADLGKPAVRCLRRSADTGVLFAERNHIAEKCVNLLIFLKARPVQPGNTVILTVCIVISILGIAELIPCIKHCRAPAAHQCRKRILYHAPAQPFNLRIIRVALHSAVPAVSIIIPVRVIPAIFLIMLVII